MTRKLQGLAGRLDGRVAVVTGGEQGVGRAVALALAACGARVVVAGDDERALAETVGEIAFGGAKARHVKGSRELGRARAEEVFGNVDLEVIVDGASDADEDAVAARVVDQVAEGATMIRLA